MRSSIALIALGVAALPCSSCSPRPQSLGTAPSTPVSNTTGLANTGASNPDPGIKTVPTKIDTGIDPYADRKTGR